jgi:hypothetical protein
VLFFVNEKKRGTIMELIKHYFGQREYVWTSTEEYLRNEPVLADAGEKWTEMTILPIRSGRELWYRHSGSGGSSRSRAGSISNSTDKERTGALDILVNDVWGAEYLLQWNVPVWDHSLEGGLRMLRLAIDTHTIDHYTSGFATDSQTTRFRYFNGHFR